MSFPLLVISVDLATLFSWSSAKHKYNYFIEKINSVAQEGKKGILFYSTISSLWNLLSHYIVASLGIG